jgi:hypothetical protein
MSIAWPRHLAQHQSRRGRRLARLMTGARSPRCWRLGGHFGRRLARVGPVPRAEVPLYTLGTAARIERIRLLYLHEELTRPSASAPLRPHGLRRVETSRRCPRITS